MLGTGGKDRVDIELKLHIIVCFYHATYIFTVNLHSQFA